MKKQIVKYAELGLMVITAFFLWKTSFNIMKTSQTESWWLPISAFALFFVFWSLGAILVKNNQLFFIATLISLFSGLFFVQSFQFAVIIAISLLILWFGRKLVREELSSRIKISIWNSLRIERRFFVFAVAIIITSQYYFGSGFSDDYKKLPKMNIGERQILWSMRIISKINPKFIGDYENINAMTVDDFIASKIANNEPSDETSQRNLMNGFKEKKNVTMVESGRKNFSDMLGENISGNEKLIEVFAKIINKKINKILDVNIGYMDQRIPIMHGVFTTLLFLSIVSIGMLISPLLIVAVWALFKLMILFGFVSIAKKEAEIEIIA